MNIQVINFANKDVSLHNGISSSNGYFHYISELLETIPGINVDRWHVKDVNLSFYDGNIIENLDLKPDLLDKINTLEKADLIIPIIPCYWGAPISTYINFINVCGGTEYDRGNIGNMMKNKLFLPLYVGANEEDAIKSTEYNAYVSQKLGFNILYNELYIGNTRNLTVRENKLFMARINKIINLLISRVGGVRIEN